MGPVPLGLWALLGRGLAEGPASALCRECAVRSGGVPPLTGETGGDCRINTINSTWGKLGKSQPFQ